MTVTRDSYQAAFGKRFNHVMTKSGMKYRDAAEKCDVAPTVICRWANGQALPTVYTFAKFCLAMKLDARTICALLGVSAR